MSPTCKVPASERRRRVTFCAPEGSVCLGETESTLRTLDDDSVDV